MNIRQYVKIIQVQNVFQADASKKRLYNQCICKVEAYPHFFLQFFGIKIFPFCEDVKRSHRGHCKLAYIFLKKFTPKKHCKDCCRINNCLTVSKESVMQRSVCLFIHNMTRTRNPVVTKMTTFQPHYGLLSQRSVCFIIVSLHFLQVDQLFQGKYFVHKISMPKTLLILKQFYF